MTAVAGKTTMLARTTFATAVLVLSLLSATARGQKIKFFVNGRTIEIAPKAGAPSVSASA